MVTISFTPNLQRHVPCPPAAVAGATLREALDNVFADNPALRSYIVDDQGRLRQHVIVFLNNQPTTDKIHLSDPVGPDDDIFVFQALSGG